MLKLTRPGAPNRNRTQVEGLRRHHLIQLGPLASERRRFVARYPDPGVDLPHKDHMIIRVTQLIL